MLKKPYFSAIIVAICAIVFQLENTGEYFGVFVNRFSPCFQDPSHSAPCFIGYDILLMGLVAIVGVVFFGIFVYQIFGKIKEWRKSKLG